MKVLKMIGAFWNIRSLNKAGSLQCLTDFIQNNKLSFVGIQETKKERFDDSFLRAIQGHFKWHSLPAVGTAGRILVGFDDNVVEILSWQNKQFTVSAMVRNNCDNFTWRLIVVYGSPYDEGKEEFINELHDLMANTMLC